MVTHGGLGSIKECVMHAVPMLVFPLDVDQPGNAARVVHHGLGHQADVRSVEGPELLDHLDALVYEDGFARHAATFRASFERVEVAEEGAALIDRMASCAPPAGAGLAGAGGLGQAEDVAPRGVRPT
jgi:UDP:flavonoid glycosyltransferase YjiC (YdhE family)